MRRAELLLVAALAGCSPALSGGPAPADAAAVEAGVRRALEGYADAVNDRRWDDVVDYYIDDASFSWVEDGRVRYASHDELVESFDFVRENFVGVEMEMDVLRVLPLAADRAHVTLTFRQTLRSAAGQSFRITGAITAVMARSGRGWRFLAGHTSTAQRRQDQ